MHVADPRVLTQDVAQLYFFVSHTAGQPWLDQHSGMTVLPVADAHRLGQSLVPPCSRLQPCDPNAREPARRFTETEIRVKWFSPLPVVLCARLEKVGRRALLR